MDNNDVNIKTLETTHGYEYLISACLCGEHTRYDGKSSLFPKLKKMVEEGKAIICCPEILGGLTIPRLPCEIKDGKVINIESEDKTWQFVDGAEKVLKIAQKYGIKKAILKEKSPSCGSNYVYDGTFSKTLIPGEGITVKLLRQNGIEVISSDIFNNIK